MNVVKKLFVFIVLLLFFFFGEIALTFSDKGYPSLLNDMEIPFSLMLDNEYSDFQETEVIDRSVTSFRFSSWDKTSIFFWCPSI